jgi:two-component system NtrC family sensor kinase
MKAPGEAALQLPWLSPCAASLLALTRAPQAAVWSEIRHDPGCVLLLVRHALPPATTSGLSLFPALLRDAAVLDAARAHLEGKPRPRGWVSWNQAEARPIYQTALACARLACHLAEQADCCAPDNAWVAGLLAPLGWLAACAADPGATAADLEAWRQRRQRPPGLDPAALARRLARRWRLPAWLGATAGYLGLPVEVAQGLGAEPGLFQVVQLAVGLLEQQGPGLGLACGRAPAELLSLMGLNRSGAETTCATLLAEVSDATFAWEPPHALPLLPELLRLAADNRRLGDLPVLETLQDEVDVLHDALHEQHAGEGDRLQTRKLGALAELAAGASHEINNPLAVISGQAQYLIKKVQSAEGKGQSAEQVGALHSALCTSLETIIGQTQRIHQILTDLMQFARPPAPRKELVDLAGVIRDVAACLQGLADERGVRLVCQAPPAPVTLYADPAQVTRALGCLLRNAVEAAPAQGWAGVRVELPQPGRLDLVIEDSGRGPPPADREHLFDPFYSGRQAGRGRGLGLPTAWRLARQHGGDVRLVPSVEGVTRFLLSLPLNPPQDITAPGDNTSPGSFPTASVA